MNFSDGQLASQFPTRGQGPFWDLFPDSTVGAYAGWAWGVSRIIDGLELTADQNQIDTTRLAVTGCSYAGKMALWAGAFDERIALTITPRKRRWRLKLAIDLHLRSRERRHACRAAD